ncbi:MAG: hypothetical protein JSS49_28215 [Planctomycetes bacterium]|nr:hypothetical protein [Planctomycetota bacterium]
MEELVRLRTALIELAEEIGITPDALEASEQIDEVFFHEEVFPANGLKKIAFNKTEVVLGICRDALEVDVRVDAISLLNLKPDTTTETLEQFRKDIANQESVTFTLRFKKTEYLRRFSSILPSAVVRMYLFAGRCASMFRGTIDDPHHLEELLWGDRGNEKCVLLIAEGNYLIDGPYLAIVSSPSFGEWKLLQSERRLSASDYSGVQRTCADSVRWEKPWMKVMIPHSLRITVEMEVGVGISQFVFAHWANASVLFLADKVRELNAAQLADFSTEKYRSQIELLREADVSESVEVSQATSLGEIVEWAYDQRWGGDRIGLVQAVIAHEFSSLQHGTKIQLLLEHARFLWRDVQWQWKLFLGGKIERFTAEERDLEAEVSDTVSGFDTEVAEMIKSLTSAMLGAVGALIGSLIAAAFKEPFNAKVFSTGVWAFFFYLLVFPGILGMTHHAIRFNTLRRVFGNRRDRFDRAIGIERVGEIVHTSIDNAETRFWRWFGVSVLAFVVVLGLCVAAVNYVPTLFPVPAQRP